MLCKNFVRDGSARLSEAEAGARDKAPAMLELIVIGVAVSGVLTLVGSIGRDRHDRLPPDALQDGISSLPLAVAEDTEMVQTSSAKPAGDMHSACPIGEGAWPPKSISSRIRHTRPIVARDLETPNEHRSH